MFNKKKKYIVSIRGSPLDEIKELEAELNNPNSTQRIFVFNKTVEVKCIDE